MASARNYPAKLLKSLPYNIGVGSVVFLLYSHHSKGNKSLGAFSYLGKAVSMLKKVI